MFKLAPFERKYSNEPAVSELYDAMDSFFKNEFFSNKAYLDNFKVDIQNKDKKYIVEADIPGVKKDDINISMDGDILVINIETKEEKEESDKKYLRKERSVFSSRRLFHLHGSNPEKITAKLDDGVLTITIPKKDIDDKKIEIEIV